MKFKLDENLARLGKALLEVEGHNVETVLDEGLSGINDEKLFEHCCYENRVLVTLDHDFGQVLRFSPAKSYGIVIPECRGQLSVEAILALVSELAIHLRCDQSPANCGSLSVAGFASMLQQKISKATAMIDHLKSDPRFASLRRSLDVYYGDTDREIAMDALYGRFLTKSALAFDIGSHVGDRIASFRRQGARVVALEPQPLCYEALSQIYCCDGAVTVLNSACGPSAGELTLYVNSANPTVTTASPDFIKAADGAGGWEGQVWDRAIAVPVTTLDALIKQYGAPAFVKIDVEGFEADVLAGLSTPVAALSFEFTTIQRDVAYQCLEQLQQLGTYGFDIALGESQRLTFNRWVTGQEMRAHIAALPHEANSGDVYAVLV